MRLRRKNSKRMIRRGACVAQNKRSAAANGIPKSISIKFFCVNCS